MTYQAKVQEWKKEAVDEFTKLMDEYDIIGVVNLKNLPARQLQIMREQLRDTVLIKMTKKRLLTRALAKAGKKDIATLEEHLKGMPALLLSNENPFKLFAIIKKNKSKAPIKGGQEAPNDITVPAGPTSFPPGPIIGELGSLGIPAGVDQGKVAVQKETVVAKEGEVVSEKLAGVLTRLGIEPMEVGLDLVAVYEKGEVITKSVLDIDVDEYAENFRNAASWAFNLAFNAGYPTADNITLMLSKGHSDALALATSEDILTDETVKNVLAKAESQGKVLEGKLGIPAEPVEEKEAKGKPAEQGEAGGEEKTEKQEPAEKAEPEKDEKAEAPAEEKEKEESSEETEEEPAEETPEKPETEEKADTEKTSNSKDSK